MSRGFTLIEVIVVIGIMALLAGLGATVSFTYLRGQRLETSAELILSETMRAQTDAYTQADDQAHGVKVLSDRVVRFEGVSYAARITAKDEIDMFPGSLTVSGLSEWAFAAASFYPGTAGTMTLTDGDQSYDLTISSYGVVEVTKSAD